MTEVLTFPIGKTAMSLRSGYPSRVERSAMTNCLDLLRDRMFKSRLELELKSARLAVMATANALISALAEGPREATGACHSPFNP